MYLVVVHECGELRLVRVHDIWDEVHLTLETAVHCRVADVDCLADPVVRGDSTCKRWCRGGEWRQQAFGSCRAQNRHRHERCGVSNEPVLGDELGVVAKGLWREGAEEVVVIPAGEGVARR